MHNGGERRVAALLSGGEGAVPDLPLSREALWAKFDDCMRFGGVEESEQLFDALFSLDKLGEVAELIRGTFPSHRAADS